ncbi:MAG: hypothetical protein ACP5Q3_13660, partial [bacterium]
SIDHYCSNRWTAQESNARSREVVRQELLITIKIKAGSVFKTNGEPKEFYGRMISEGISPAKPEVVHYAYAFAVPIIFP